MTFFFTFLYLITTVTVHIRLLSLLRFLLQLTAPLADSREIKGSFIKTILGTIKAVFTEILKKMKSKLTFNFLPFLMNSGLLT